MEHLVFVRLMDELGLRDKLFKGIAKSVAPVSQRKKKRRRKWRNLKIGSRRPAASLVINWVNLKQNFISAWTALPHREGRFVNSIINDIHGQWRDTRQAAVIHREGWELACFHLLVWKLKLTSLNFPIATIILLLNDSYYNLQESISAAWVIVAILQYVVTAEHFIYIYIPVTQNKCSSWSKKNKTKATACIYSSLSESVRSTFSYKEFSEAQAFPFFCHQMNLSCVLKEALH